LLGDVPVVFVDRAGRGRGQDRVDRGEALVVDTAGSGAGHVDGGRVGPARRDGVSSAGDRHVKGHAHRLVPGDCAPAGGGLIEDTEVLGDGVTRGDQAGVDTVERKVVVL